MLIYHKNKLIDETKFQISVMAPGFQYGIGFFTTMKFDEGQIQFLEKHLNRLHQSAKQYNINVENVDIEKKIYQTIESNRLKAARVKTMIYLDADNVGRYVIIPQSLHINRSPKNLLVKISHRGNRDLYQYKSMNYFENIYLKKTLEKTEFDDYLFINEKNEIMETCFSNIFFKKGNDLFTPSTQLPILNGITRQVIIVSNKKTIIEKSINLNTIDEFDCCFLTNSIHGAVPVTLIFNGKKVIDYNIDQKLLLNINNQVLKNK